jgi:hypothetical protein
MLFGGALDVYSVASIGDDHYQVISSFPHFLISRFYVPSL